MTEILLLDEDTVGTSRFGTSKVGTSNVAFQESVVNGASEMNCQNLSASYPKVKPLALEGLNFNLKPGELLVRVKKS